MKKAFYISLIIFFLSGTTLFYLLDKNSESIKGKMKEKFGKIATNEEIIINDSSAEVETIEKDFLLKNKGIVANIGVGELRIESYEGDKIKIKSQIPKKAMNSYSIEELDDNLIIKANVAQKILVMVPKNHELKANIKLGIGDFYGENLNNVEIEINTGDVVGNNLSNVKKLQLDLGDLELNASKNIEKIELKTGSGKIELLEQDRDFTITNNLGDIDFSITNKFDGEISGKVKLGDTKINNLNSSGKKYKGNITVDLGELNITGIN